MAVVAGIDEAGYGPRLGPLVVSAVAFEVPDEAADGCLWERLAPVVGRSARDRARVPVDDSKRLFSQAVGPRHIERAALAFAAAAGLEPSSFRGLLAAVAEAAEGPEAYPWYAGADFAVPLAAEPAQLAADARRLREAEGARFLEVRVHPVLVGEYNRLVDSAGTKSATLFHKTSLLLAHLWQRWGERRLVVHVDKHGGRDRYGLLLHQTFFGSRVKVLGEGRSESLYEVSDGRRGMTVGFYREGDGRHLPIALASIYSKYLRELFMRGFNAWWAEQVPGLKPTAGYAADARRFLRDIADARRALGIDDRLLIRIA
jgi:hypothetical protein